MIKSQILHRYLEAVSPGLSSRLNFCDVFFFGAGGSGKSFLSMYPELSPKGFLDSSTSLWNTMVQNVRVFSPSEVSHHDPDSTVIFITSDYRSEITKDLASRGFSESHHLLAGRPPVIDFDNQYTLFFRRFSDLYHALSSASSRSDRVVVLRDFANLPRSTPGDVDVIASKSNYEKLQLQSAGTKYFPGAYRLDVYLDIESPRPYLPKSVMDLVQASAKPTDSIFVADSLGFAASFSYHIVLHKSPLFSGIDSSNARLNGTTKYTANIDIVLDKLGLDASRLSQVSLIKVLQDNGWTPSLSELSRIAAAHRASVQGNVALESWFRWTSSQAGALPQPK